MSEPLKFFDKQWGFLESPLRRINILSGSVRSGKTTVSLWKWALWVLTQPLDREFLMIAKNMTTLKRNCLFLLEKIVGKDNFKWSLTAKSGVLFGHTVYLEGANDERAEGKIRGMTIAGAYCDEISMYPEDFVSMLLTRLSDGDGCLIATTNPDHPKHFLKVKYMDNKELDIAVWTFLLDDNTFLSKDYVDNIKKELKGVFYKRFILGLWVRAEGLVFDVYADDPERFYIDEAPDDLLFITIGTDFGGNKSKTVFVATGVTKGYKRVVVLGDHEIKGGKGTIDANKVNTEYIKFVKQITERFGKRKQDGRVVIVPVKFSFADSAEQYLITGMQAASMREGLTPPVDSLKAKINDRVFFLYRLLVGGRFHIMRGCTVVPRSLAGLAWDEKEGEQDKILDIPGETPNDGFDGLSYSIERFIKYFEFKGAA